VCRPYRSRHCQGFAMYNWNNHQLTKIINHSCFSNIFQGKGVFETILVTENNHLCLWDRHVLRLQKGIAFLGKQPEFDFSLLHQSLKKHFQKIESQTCYRLNLIYLPGNDILMIRYFPYQFPQLPAKLYTSDQYFRGNSPHYQYKTLSRMEYVFFQQLAKENQCDDFLFIDTNKNFLETCLANIFFFRSDGRIETPIASNMPLLNGVMRQYLLSSQKAIDIQCTERCIQPDDLGNYTQAFITNGLRLIQPVSQVGQWKYSQTDFGWHLRNHVLKQIVSF